METLFTTATSQKYALRRERIFMVLAGLFLGTLGIINILGVSRFIDLSLSLGDYTLPMILPLGVLPYPVTFLCADLISEFYGKHRATLIIWIGLLVNVWILFILWLAGYLPPHVTLDPSTQLPEISHPDFAFYKIRIFTLGSIFGSMLAYIVAQLLDVHLFQYWKKLTAGKHLWLRYNASMLISQFVDTVIVLVVACLMTHALPPAQPGESILQQLMTLIFSCYVFKMMVALIDTLPFYLAVVGLRRYLNLPAFPPKPRAHPLLTFVDNN